MRTQPTRFPFSLAGIAVLSAGAAFLGAFLARPAAAVAVAALPKGQQGAAGSITGGTAATLFPRPFTKAELALGEVQPGMTTAFFGGNFLSWMTLPAVAPGEVCLILGETTMEEATQPKSLWEMMKEKDWPAPRATPTPAPAWVRTLEEEISPSPPPRAGIRADGPISVRWFRIRCGNTEGWTTRVALTP